MTEPVAATIYAKQLTNQKEGYPLWDPDPHSEPAVEIADVGYVESGAWVRLFNASKSPDDTSNKFGVPTGYYPLKTGAILERTSLPANVPIQSESVLQLGAQATITGGIFTPAGGGFSFECSKEQGAVLLLGDDADRRDALHKHAFIRYIREHHERWLQFANQVHERGIALNDLLLVTGCDKTSAWASAAFSAKSSQAAVSLNTGQAGVVQGEVSMSWAWKNSASVVTRSGPRRRVPSVTPSMLARTTSRDGDVIMTEARHESVALSLPAIRDQCVFLRGYRICDRNTWTARRLWRKKKPAYDGFVYVSHKHDKEDPSSGPSDSSNSSSGPSSDPSGSQSSSGGDGGAGGSGFSSSGGPFEEPDRPSDSPEADSIDGNCGNHEMDEDLEIYMQTNYDKEPTLWDTLLEYILENSKVDLAMIHDDDITPLLQGNDSCDSFQSRIREIKPKIFVNDNQVGMFETTYQTSFSENRCPHSTTNSRSKSSTAKPKLQDDETTSRLPLSGNSDIGHAGGWKSTASTVNHELLEDDGYSSKRAPVLRPPVGPQPYPSPSHPHLHPSAGLTSAPYAPTNTSDAHNQPCTVADTSQLPAHARSISTPLSQPITRRLRQPRSFAVYDAQFNPQVRLQDQFPRSYVHPGSSPPLPAPFKPHQRGSSQGGQFRFQIPDPHAEDGEGRGVEDEENQQGRKAKAKRHLSGASAPGACDPCKLSKVKCVFHKSEHPCRRCVHGGYDCRVSGQKQKPKPPSHAELLRRLREQDHIIYGLLLPGQIFSTAATLPSDPNIDFAMAAKASIQNDHSSNLHGTTAERDACGPVTLPALPVWDKHTPKRDVERRVDAWIAQAKKRLLQSASKGMNGGPRTNQGTSGNIQYLKSDVTGTPYNLRWNIPSDSPKIPAIPEILTRRIVTQEEVDRLFEVFFDKINMFFSICDPVIHTPSHVLKTSAFLYTTICAVASRYYPQRPEIYPQLLDSAKKAAGSALNEARSIETCQAYLLLGVYHPPARTFWEDRTFLYYGLAIRMATDLELHVPPAHSLNELRTEHYARALLNRTRVWLNCFCNDRSISTQLGKPSAIPMPANKAIPFDLRQWWRSSQYNGPHDIHMCAYANLLQVMSGFHDMVYSDASSVDGMNENLDLRLVQSYADDITAVGKDWTLLLAVNYAENPSPSLMWRDNIWPFLVSYAKLVVLSFGLQHGLRQGLRQANSFSNQCIDAATDVLKRITGNLAKLGYLRYCVEAYFLFTSFAAAFLLKILRPKFSFMMSDSREQDIIKLVQRLIDLFGSKEVAIDDRHAPKLYSRFLASVLTQHMHDKMSERPQVPRPTTTSAKRQGTSQSIAFHQERGSRHIYPVPQLGQLPISQYASQCMEVDKPLLAEEHVLQDDMMLASMSAITDPHFWEQGTMPGFSWTTSERPWPMAVDERDEISPVVHPTRQ